jgi:predicted ATPase
LWRGALLVARQHLVEASAHHTPDQHHLMVFRIGQDPGVACRMAAAMTLWLLGYPDQALTHLHDALTLAHALAHPFSLAYAQCWATCLYQWRRDVQAVYEQAEAAVALSIEQGFPQWAAHGMISRGWALAMQNQDTVGMVQVRQGITARRATRVTLNMPYLYTVLVEVCDHLGHTEEGLEALAEASALLEHHEEHWWQAEVSRLRGVLLLQQPRTPQAEAETWLQRALDVARHQKAKSLELRAAMSLSRLWQSQGKHQDAYDLLAPVYEWFTEGFDTVNLIGAKQLLGELRTEKIPPTA